MAFSQQPGRILSAQEYAIRSLAKEQGFSDIELENYTLKTYGKSLNELSRDQATKLISDFQGQNPPRKGSMSSLPDSSPVLAEILEVGMAKLFYLVDGNRVQGTITDIVDNKCVIETKDGLLNIPMTDILEESVDLTKKDDTRYKGPLLTEDNQTLVIRSNYGDVLINKKDIKKLDRYHGGRLVPWQENKKTFYQGEAQLTSVFLDPTAFSLSGNTFYISGLSIGYGFTDRFMVTTQFGANFNQDLNLNPRMRFFHKKTADKESALSWGLGFHRAYPVKSVISKYAHAFTVNDGTTKTSLNEYNPDESLWEHEHDRLIDYIIEKEDERKVFVEGYLVYSSRRNNPTGRGKVGYSVGFKTSNAFMLNDPKYTFGENNEFSLTFDDKNDLQFSMPFRFWASFEYDMQKNLKFVGSMWIDNSSRSTNFENVVEDYFGGDGTPSFSFDSMAGDYNIFDFDFGFLYAINDNMRIGMHFQQPYLDFYWEFFEF